VVEGVAGDAVVGSVTVGVLFGRSGRPGLPKPNREGAEMLSPWSGPLQQVDGVDVSIRLREMSYKSPVAEQRRV
jgi:hypothetical protein